MSRGDIAVGALVGYAASRAMDAATSKPTELAAGTTKDRSLAETHRHSWLAWASRSKLRPFVTLARTLRRYRDTLHQYGVVLTPRECGERLAAARRDIGGEARFSSMRTASS